MFDKAVADMQKIRHWKQLEQLSEQPIIIFSFIKFNLKYDQFRYFSIGYLLIHH
jgi:hypothetical protein